MPIFVPTRGTPPAQESAWVHYVPDAATAMREAKAAAGDENVMVHGAGLAQSLLRERLLDELEIQLIPVVLGDGRRLFGAPALPGDVMSGRRPILPMLNGAARAEDRRD